MVCDGGLSGKILRDEIILCGFPLSNLNDGEWLHGGVVVAM